MCVLSCGRERPFRLFEVLTRNRQSAVGLLGRRRSAREQPPRMFTIPPRQQLSSPIQLAIRTWRVTLSIKSTQHTHTRTRTHTLVKTHITQREKLLIKRNAKKNVKLVLLNTLYLRCFPKEKECEREERTTTALVLL